MSFINYKGANNASTNLVADVLASATSIIITDGDQNILPNQYPYLLTLEHLNVNNEVTVREIVKVTSGNANTLVIERGAGICVQDDTVTSRVQANTPHTFYAGDKVSLYWTNEQLQDIQGTVKDSTKNVAIADVYNTTTSYSVWDIVIHDGVRYVCNATTTGAFDPSKWTAITVQSSIDDVNDNIDGLDSRLEIAEQKISSMSAVSADVLAVWGWGSGGYGNSGTCYYKWAWGGGWGFFERHITIPTSICVKIWVGGNSVSANCSTWYKGCTTQLLSWNVPILSVIGGGYGSYWNWRGYPPDGGDGANWGGSGSSCCSASRLWGNPEWNIDGMLGNKWGNGNGVSNNSIYCAGWAWGGGYWGPWGESATGGGCWGNGVKSSILGVRVSWGWAWYWGANWTWGGSSCYGWGWKGWANGTASWKWGDGVVAIRYPSTWEYGIHCAVWGTITTCTIGGIEYTIHTFTSDGTFTVVS